MSYLVFIFSFYVCATLGLIIDIFFSNLRITNLSIETIKKEYSLTSYNVLINVSLLSLPIFITQWLMISTYEFTFLRFILQTIGTVFLGLSLSEIINYIIYYSESLRDFKVNYLYKYGLMTFFLHPVIFYLKLAVYVLPGFLGYYPVICNSWIVLWMCKEVIYDNCDLQNLHWHKIELNKFVKNNLKQLNINLKTNLKCGSANENANENANANVDGDDNADKKTKNESYFESLLKTNKNENDKKIKTIFGRLHYSNFI